MGLAAFCAYPARYFDDLRANSDEELEVERNDVRDLLRAVTGSGETGSTSDSKSDEAPMRVALQVLFHLLQACEKSVASAYESQQLFEESVVHAFSSLGTSSVIVCGVSTSVADTFRWQPSLSITWPGACPP